MKTLEAEEKNPAWSGRYVVRYRGKVINDDIDGKDLFSWALENGYTHIQLKRVHAGFRRFKIPQD